MAEYAKPDVLVEHRLARGAPGGPGHPGDRGGRGHRAPTRRATSEGRSGGTGRPTCTRKVGRDYVDQAGLSGLLPGAGVGPDTTVVLYGGNNNWFAAYAYWLLEAPRLRRREAPERRPQEVGAREPRAHAGRRRARRDGFTISGASGPRSARSATRCSQGRIGTGLVDVRSPEEFRGEKLAPDHLPQEQSQVPGHIPGAANIPWAKAANEDGTFKCADELTALYEAEGITGDGEIIAYCRIGERSCHTWFALQELLGYPNVKNYDGSWTEYGSLVGAPVEKG